MSYYERRRNEGMFHVIIKRDEDTKCSFEHYAECFDSGERWGGRVVFNNRTATRCFSEIREGVERAMDASNAAALNKRTNTRWAAGAN